MPYCTLRRTDSLCALFTGTYRFCVSRKGGTGGSGWGHHWVLYTWQLLGLAVKRTMIGTGLANSRSGCMSRLRKCYTHLSGGSFLAGKAFWALSGCLPTVSADYCMLVNEWTWLRSQLCLLSLKAHLGSFLESELRQK